jgi:preprotein translocase subunit SecY
MTRHLSQIFLTEALTFMITSGWVEKDAERWDQTLCLTAGGAIYLSFICVMPTILADNFGVPFGFGGTGLLIIVSVCMQTVSQVESYMLNDVVGTQSNPQVASKGRRKKFQGRRNN